MAIYIKGMDMPGICAKCPFFTEWRDHGICDLTHIDMFFIEKIISMRHEKCPLIEVPEPHGRLIDADKLYATVQSNESVDAYVRFLLRHSPTVIEADMPYREDGE